MSWKKKKNTRPKYSKLLLIVKSLDINSFYKTKKKFAHCALYLYHDNILSKILTKKKKNILQSYCSALIDARAMSFQVTTCASSNARYLLRVVNKEITEGACKTENKSRLRHVILQLLFCG